MYAPCVVLYKHKQWVCVQISTKKLGLNSQLLIFIKSLALSISLLYRLTKLKQGGGVNVWAEAGKEKPKQKHW